MAGSCELGRTPMPGRGLRAVVTAAAMLIAAVTFGHAQVTPPLNIIIILADNLGYGDLGSYGHPTIRTPHLDRLAAEGQRWTSFYAGATVCSPSRAALLTGRQPVRSGVYRREPPDTGPGSSPGVFTVSAAAGLPHDEVTIAEMLKDRGYATAIIGKWHLGHLPEFLPARQGFDLHFGLPYSNDMGVAEGVKGGRETNRQPRSENYTVPLLRNGQVVEQPVQQDTLTKRYTEEAVRYIRAHRDKPFFLYVAHAMPHVPLFRSESSRVAAPPACTATWSKSSTGVWGKSSRSCASPDWIDGRSSSSRATTDRGRCMTSRADRRDRCERAKAGRSRAAGACRRFSGLRAG